MWKPQVPVVASLQVVQGSSSWREGNKLGVNFRHNTSWLCTRGDRFQRVSSLVCGKIWYKKKDNSSSGEATHFIGSFIFHKNVMTYKTHHAIQEWRSRYLFHFPCLVSHIPQSHIHHIELSISLFALLYLTIFHLPRHHITIFWSHLFPFHTSATTCVYLILLLKWQIFHKYF